MNDLFAKGAAMLAGAMRKNASRPVVITNRLNNPTLIIETDATVGSTEFEESSNDGVIVLFNHATTSSMRLTW